MIDYERLCVKLYDCDLVVNACGPVCVCVCVYENVQVSVTHPREPEGLSVGSGWVGRSGVCVCVCVARGNLLI